MKISAHIITETLPEAKIFEDLLSLDGKNILELGCGDAVLTRLIAEAGKNRAITAAEVDTVQHEKNLLIDDLPNVKFIISGSEDIPLDTNSIDSVFMFKSLHHVPVDSMDKAMEEVSRVLKPGGYAYISEPVFEGEFNEVLRLFHDEETVRLAAFSAMVKSVQHGLLISRDEIFFNTESKFENFLQFDDQVIKVTHSHHRLSDELYQRVEEKFDHYFIHNKGVFLNPTRVDLLQKPG